MHLLCDEANTRNPIRSHPDLAERLLLLMLETHAWMAARPRRERMHELGKLEDHVKNTTEIEEQQGRSFITRFRVFDPLLFHCCYLNLHQLRASDHGPK